MGMAGHPGLTARWCSACWSRTEPPRRALWLYENLASFQQDKLTLPSPGHSLEHQKRAGSVADREQTTSPPCTWIFS